jgi:hypothetical protein
MKVAALSVSNLTFIKHLDMIAIIYSKNDKKNACMQTENFNEVLVLYKVKGYYAYSKKIQIYTTDQSLTKSIEWKNKKESKIYKHTLYNCQDHFHNLCYNEIFPS